MKAMTCQASDRSMSCVLAPCILVGRFQRFEKKHALSISSPEDRNSMFLRNISSTDKSVLPAKPENKY
jgi:hypothetical protein